MARILVAANSSWNLQNFRGNLIQSLGEAGHEVATASPDEKGVETRLRPIRHLQWKMHRSSTGPLNNMRSLVEIISLIRREKPDVFLGFTIKPNIYGCVACRLLGVSAIPNVSGLGTAFLGRSAFRRVALHMYRFAFSGASTVFFQNTEDESLFLNAKVVRPGQSRVLPGSGVDLEHYLPAKLPEGLSFLMIARVLGDKGVREYVNAARSVRRKFPNAKFVLLGELDPHNPSGVPRHELDEWVRDGFIEYAGSTTDVRPFIAASSAVVLPSYREGLPRTLLEAAAMGRPLIGTDVPGCRQVIRDGVTGFLCEARNANSLALAIEQFAKAPFERRQQIGANARIMVEEEFDERRVFDAYLSAIDELPF